MQKSSEEEIRAVDALIEKTKQDISKLLKADKKVHIIWDFDGVLADSRSDDVFSLSKFDLKVYFDHEERLLLESPEPGPWLLPLAHEAPVAPRFPLGCVTQDIVTVRSSMLAFRVQLFCLQWYLRMRWMLFVGHQPKKEAYRIILKSLKADPDYHVFCIDDAAKHIDGFREVCAEEGMQERSCGIVSPVLRSYSKEELEVYLSRVMNAKGVPIRVRDPSDDCRGFIVLPEGVAQFKRQISTLLKENSSEGHGAELRAAFVKVNGEVGHGRFKTEEELQQTMRNFIMDLACP
ncbi:MAG: 5'-nucleotidase [bacterium]|nr:5'-nucleotidase [bacterium]